MNCCDSFGKCTQGANCPASETRGQTLYAERKWGEMPIQYLGDESEDPPHTEMFKDMFKGAVIALAAVVFGVFVGLALYLK